MRFGDYIIGQSLFPGILKSMECFERYVDVYKHIMCTLYQYYELEMTSMKTRIVRIAHLQLHDRYVSGNSFCIKIKRIAQKKSGTVCGNTERRHGRVRTR